MNLNESIINIGKDYIKIERVGDEFVEASFDP